MKAINVIILLFIIVGFFPGCHDEVHSPKPSSTCEYVIPEIPDWNLDSTRISLDDERSVHDLYFREGGKGLIATDHQIWRTEDDGVTWQKVFEGPQRFLYHLIFTDSLHGFLACEFDKKACLLKTMDGGMSWDSICFNPYILFENIAFSDSNIGVAIFLNKYFQLSLQRTIDGGKTWNKVDGLTDLKSNGALSLSAGGFGYHIGDHGKIYTTDDFGLSWNLIETGYTDVITGQFLDPINGFLSGFYYTIKTTDGGVSWDTISNYPTSYIHFFSKMDGLSLQVLDTYWAIDVEYPCNAFLVTHDGGQTWKKSESSFRSFFESPVIVNENLAYGIANNLLIKIYR